MDRLKTYTKEDLINVEFKFSRPNSRIFFTGVALSGKSTISPKVAARIDGCTLQNMDILRLTAQIVESQKPEGSRNPFVFLGSCDAYTAVGNGTFTPESLVSGFNNYAEAVSSQLEWILPSLEAQGARDVAFEGVQLTPNIVKRHQNDTTRLIIVTSTEQQLRENAVKMFGDETDLLERYSPEKLLLLQNEILKQADQFPKDKLLIIDNTDTVSKAVSSATGFLFESGLIEPR